MQKIIQLEKMRSSLIAGRVHYSIYADSEEISLNPLIDTKIGIHFTNKIHCVCCGKSISKTFFNGYCFQCYNTAPEAEECVLHPEKCRAHEGIARNMEYATEHCLSPQVVYLALSGGIKVGVTRQSQVPTRWIDQGASHAVVIATVPNRFLAGSIEVALKQHIADKTNWRKLLTGDIADMTLLHTTRKQIETILPVEFRQYLQASNEIIEIQYPVLSYLPKAISINLDKQPSIEGRLLGIKGQYLFIENQGALNIRNHSGYEINLSF